MSLFVKNVIEIDDDDVIIAFVLGIGQINLAQYN